MSNSHQTFKQGKNATVNLKAKVRLFDLYAFNIESIIKRMQLALQDPESENDTDLLTTEAKAGARASYIEKSIIYCLNQDLLKLSDSRTITASVHNFIRTIAADVTKKPSDTDANIIKTKLQNDTYEQLKKLDLKQENFSLNNIFLCRQYGLSDQDIELLRMLVSSTTPKTNRTDAKADLGLEAEMTALLEQTKAIRLLKHAIYVIPGIYEDQHPQHWSIRIGGLFIQTQSESRINALRVLAEHAMPISCFTQDIKTGRVSLNLKASDEVANILLQAYKKWHGDQTSKDISTKMHAINDHHQARMLAILLSELHESNFISAEMKKDISKTMDVEEIQRINTTHPTLYPALRVILNELKTLLTPAQPAAAPTTAATTAAAARK